MLLRFVERQTDHVRELAHRDELIGLPNRRAWTDELPRVLEQPRYSGQPVSIGMLDLDHFKSSTTRSATKPATGCPKRQPPHG